MVAAIVMDLVCIWVAFLVWEFIWTLCSALSIQDGETMFMWTGASLLGLAAAIALTVMAISGTGLFAK